MEITPTNNMANAARVSQKPPAGKGPRPVSGPSAIPPTDKLDLSPVALFSSKLSSVDEIRHEKVAELKKLISSGKYETQQRFEKTAERILEELG